MVFSCMPSFAPAYDDLKKAAKHGDTNKAARILKSTHPDPPIVGHQSALQITARYGKLETAKQLVEAGADVNWLSDGTPLTDAAAFGHVDMVKYFLEHNGNASTGKDGASALHMACRNGHAPVVQLLVEAAPDKAAAVNAADARGQTPLHYAASMPTGGAEVVSYLLQQGSNGEAADNDGNTPLHLAAVVGNTGNIKVLCDALGPQGVAACNKQQRTPLHAAAKYGRAGAVHQLLTCLADMPGADQEGSTALHMACQSLLCGAADQFNMAKALLEAGADPVAKDKAGKVAREYTTSPQLQELLSAAEAKAAPAAEEAAPAAQEAAAAPAAPTKADQIALAMQEGLAAAAAGNGEAAAGEGEQAPPVSWIAKQALRPHTSEEGTAGDWKLGTKASSSVQQE